jgi:hypothetical protein
MKHLRKMEANSDLPMTNDENVNLIRDMIMVGLKYDFFGSGGKVDSPEFEFLLESDDPKYKIRGFIDKPVVYKRGKKIKIVDYKSSKYKFRGEELKSNVQAMTYTLAAKEHWPKFKPTAEFLFLRFPRSPVQQLEFTEEQLNGFKQYLAFAFSQINNFTEETATTNYAADKKKDAWLCKIGKWRCPYLDEYDFYVEVDPDGTEVRSCLKKEEIEKSLGENNTIKKKHYDGCPRHKGEFSGRGILDLFV